MGINMFCSSLRRRSSFASVVPSLVAPSGLAVKGSLGLDNLSPCHQLTCVESQLDTHDIAVAVPECSNATFAPKTKRTLRLLLLSPNNMSDERFSATIARIQHFIALTGGIDIAIIMSLSASNPFSTAKHLLDPSQTDGMDGLHGYAILQSTFVTSAELAWIPILPLAELSGLVELVKTHAKAINRPTPKPSSAVRPLDMLAHCSPDHPLPPLAVSLTSDICSSMSHVAHAALTHRATSTHNSESLPSSEDAAQSIQSTRTAFDILMEQLDGHVVENMIDFWADDWAVE
jgi:hypothetical protein